MRTPLIAANWKLHGSLSKVDAYIASLARAIAGVSSVDASVLVCPPHAYLERAVNAAKSTDGRILIGAQNVSEQTSGAFTGEVSVEMLQDLGVTFALVGHSERRQLFGEQDEWVAQKLAACLKTSDSDQVVTPVLCVGETLLERQEGSTEMRLAQQLDAVLEVVGIDGLAQAVIAYEPVWAIGTGETASEAQAQAAHAFIRSHLSLLDAQKAEGVRILYGGSVKPGNAAGLLAQPDIDGALVGGASLEADSFAAICTAVH